MVFRMQTNKAFAFWLTTQKLFLDEQFNLQDTISVSFKLYLAKDVKCLIVFFNFCPTPTSLNTCNVIKFISDLVSISNEISKLLTQNVSLHSDFKEFIWITQVHQCYMMMTKYYYPKFHAFIYFYRQQRTDLFFTVITFFPPSWTRIKYMFSFTLTRIAVTLKVTLLFMFNYIF